MPFRSRYWTCSRFADWLRGTAKPESETGSGWQRWRRLAETTHPVRYWLAETGLSHVQNVINWIPDRINSIRYYINNRWVTRTHALTAHPRDIPRGTWRDVGDRFLPCLFNELVDFVEIELAWSNCMWNMEERRRWHMPWWRRWYRRWRCPAAAMAYLEWASQLTNEEWLADDEKHLAEPTQQAIVAREITELYRWWTEVYAKRPDPMDASGWSAYCAARWKRDDDLLMDDDEDLPADLREQGRRALDRSREIEAAYDAEDEAMMIRLIRIRRGLWT